MKPWQLLARMPIYKLYKRVELPDVLPFSYVFLLSYKCNSRCRTCNLWKRSGRAELSTEDWLKVIASIGNSAAWVTLTGGEPFCHPDIDRIAAEVLKKSRPGVLCIPSNGSLPAVIEEKVRKILQVKGGYELIINLSLDDIGERHDELRGMPGGFAKLEETMQRLKTIKDKRLKIGINTVISRHNIDRIFQIYQYVALKLRPDDYIFETAQERVELATSGEDFRMDKKRLTSFLKFLVLESRGKLLSKRGMSFVKNSIRMQYYRHLLEPKKGACNAGILSCQIMPDGGVVSCGVRGEHIGRLEAMDFPRLWRGAAAKRAKFRRLRCSCQLANIFYINRF
jgi:MoaA/NifB/PqqE/SkfB family radical SAM enzyme